MHSIPWQVELWKFWKKNNSNNDFKRVKNKIKEKKNLNLENYAFQTVHAASSLNSPRSRSKASPSSSRRRSPRTWLSWLALESAPQPGFPTSEVLVSRLKMKAFLLKRYYQRGLKIFTSFLLRQNILWSATSNCNWISRIFFAGSGLYDNLQKYNLPDPQAIFEIGFFRKNPEPFFALAKELVPEHLKVFFTGKKMTSISFSQPERTISFVCSRRRAFWRDGTRR